MTWTRESMHWIYLVLRIYVCVCVCTFRRPECLGRGQLSPATVSLGRIPSSGSPPFPCPSPTGCSARQWLGRGHIFPSSLDCDSLHRRQEKVHFLFWSFLYTLVCTCESCSLSLSSPDIFINKISIDQDQNNYLVLENPYNCSFSWLRRQSCLYRPQEKWSFFLASRLMLFCIHIS